MDTLEFFEDFDTMEPEVKRQVLQEQIDSYFAQAFAWKVKATVLRRQKGYVAKRALREREFDAALGNAQLNLESMQILVELMDELLPMEHSESTPATQLTVDNMGDVMSLEDMEAAAALGAEKSNTHGAHHA